MREIEIDRGDRVLRVREAGDPGGPVVIYFHGTPGSRLDLWYGTDDRFAPLAHGRWLAENLPGARLVIREGEGHFGIMEHLSEMLDALTAPDPAA